MCVYFVLGATSDVGSLVVSSKKVKGFCSTLIQQPKKMMAEIGELKQMVEKLQKQGFTIKGSSYEVMVHACMTAHCKILGLIRIS